MSRKRTEIVQDLLREANYYWYDNNEDKVNPLNPDDFDPIVDKIFKANSVELEKLYDEIADSQREIVLGLSQALVPDQSLLPEPGFTVAQIIPKALRVHTTPEDKYQISGQNETGEKIDYYFTPLFDHQYPKCELQAVLTQNMAILVEDGEWEAVQAPSGKNMTSSIWLGLAIEQVKEGDRVPFFLGNHIIDEFDKDFHTFHHSRWLLNGDPELELKVERGGLAFESSTARESKNGLLDTLELASGYENQILSRLSNSFLLLSLPTKLAEGKSVKPASAEIEEMSSKLQLETALTWIKIELNLPIPGQFLLQNRLYPNCIPLVNRQLLENNVVKQNYDRILLPMPTTDLFLDVFMVQDSSDIEEGISYPRIKSLQPDSQPGTYSLRSGARVRRMNRDDASQNIHRLLEVIQDEYNTFKEEGVHRLQEDFDVIDKAINRIKSHMPELFREKERKSSFFCIANFKPNVSRLYYKYWETQGDAINQLGNKIDLALTSDDVNIVKSKSIIPIQKGKGMLTADDYMNQLKITLLSRGRIMTKGDIELYSKSRYGHLLQVVSIDRKLTILENGKRGRGIFVNIQFNQPIGEASAEMIRTELQNDLNAKSAFFTQIKVAVSYEKVI